MVEGGLGGGALTGDGGEQFVCAQCGGAANQRYYYLYSPWKVGIGLPWHTAHVSPGSCLQSA